MSINLNDCKPGDICIMENGDRLMYGHRRNHHEYPHVLVTGQTYRDDGRYATATTTEFDIVKVIHTSISDEEIIRRAEAITELRRIAKTTVRREDHTAIPLDLGWGCCPAAPKDIIDKLNDAITKAWQDALDAYRKHLRAIADGITTSKENA